MKLMIKKWKWSYRDKYMNYESNPVGEEWNAYLLQNKVAIF